MRWRGANRQIVKFRKSSHVFRFTQPIFAAGDGCELDYGRYTLPLWTNPSGETAARKCILDLGLIWTISPGYRIYVRPAARVQSDDMPVLTCHARFTCVGLLQTPRLRVDYHTRQLEPKKPGGRGATIDDWLWLEYGDRVNVLVQVRAGGRWPPCTGRGEVAPL